ncbi:hypothetical protein L1887_06445 [Cichorium endivia]|nr:hypothetical protein L1887_06445 [Cichorium endivia]
MKELEALLALNDIELNSMLEPYEQFDSSRKGPYRALQSVTILIFVIHNRSKLQNLKSSKPKKTNSFQLRFECRNSISVNRVLHASMKTTDRLNCSLIMYDGSTRKFLKKNERDCGGNEFHRRRGGDSLQALTRHNSEPIVEETSSMEEEDGFLTDKVLT